MEVGSRLVGVEAVIDKDLASCVLAQTVAADAFLILTDVDAVYSAYGTPRQERLAEMSANQAWRLLAQGDFGLGSMGPKVDAAASFADATGLPAYITQLTDGARALAGEAGTRISPDRHPAPSGRIVEGAMPGAGRFSS